MPENKSGWYQATQYVPSANAATEGLLKEHYEFYNSAGDLLVSLSAEQVDSLIALATKVKATSWVNPRAPVLPPKQPVPTATAPPTPATSTGVNSGNSIPGAATGGNPQVTVEAQATSKA